MTAPTEALREIFWDPSYAIGIEEIDRQHMEFTRLLRRFNLGLQKETPSPSRCVPTNARNRRELSQFLYDWF